MIASKGLSRSFTHRHPIRRISIPLLGVIFVIAGLFYTNAEENSEWLLGTVLIIVGIIYLFLPVHRRRQALRNMFAGRAGNIIVEMKTHDEALEIKTSDSTGTAAWSSFVDFLICSDGILLYPQKSMHFWIPKTAEIEDGTWQDFTDLISSKITQKI